MTMQFKSPSRQETPRRLVTIGNVDINNLIASAIDFNGGGTLTIDLTCYNNPIIQFPKSGEQWYVELIQQRWVLSKKDIIGSPSYLNKNVGPGDQLWDCQGNISASVLGSFSLSDSNGSLTTIAPAQWTNLSINSSFLSQRSSNYPSAIQVIKVNNNTIFIRGEVNIIGGLTSLTNCATIPSGNFSPTALVEFPIKSDQANVGLVIIPSGSSAQLQFDWTGSSPTWALIHGSWCNL